MVYCLEEVRSVVKRPLCFSGFIDCAVPCGGPKKSPRTSSIVQIVFLFWSFEISKILRILGTGVYLSGYRRRFTKGH